jgi:hypothetical protein
MKHIKFCDCLKLLLSALGISSNRLAKVINVDSSLVNRWINGKRIPSYHTDYIDKISEFMAKNIFNTYQRQRINSIIADVCGINHDVLDIRDQIKFMLSEAQGYSIECQQRERNEYINKPAVKRPEGKKTAAVQGDPAPFRKSLLTLSANDRILVGAKNMVQATLSILETAAANEPGQDNSIYIAYDNYYNLDNYGESTVKTWINTLLRALDNGWKLMMLIRFAPDTDRTLKFINFIKPLVRSSQINLYYIKKYDSYVMGEELLIVPGIGALICFSGNPNASENHAFYLTTPAAISIYLSHLKLLIEKTSRSLIKRHEGNLSYSHVLMKTEEAAGNRFLYRYCFGMLTIPEDLYLKLLKKRNLSEQEAQKSTELYYARRKAFLFHIQRYQYRDIYVSSCIKDLIKDRQIYFYSYDGVELMNVDVADIIKHLSHIILLLETYNNYNIAFHKYDPDSSICSKNLYCLIKERQSVLFEIINTKSELSDIRITTDEPMLVSGFYEYLNNVWDHIPPVNKNKHDVISWIRNEIKALRMDS